MTKYFHHIQFETNVILSSLFQTITVISVLFTSLNCILELFFLVQITTFSFIIKRLSVISIQEEKKKCGNTIFATLNFFNFFLFLAYQISFYSDAVFFPYRIYIELFYRGYLLIVAVVLIGFGTYLLTLINSLAREGLRSTLNISGYLSSGGPRRERQIQEEPQRDIYYHTRSRQIKFLIYVFFIYSILQLLFSLFRCIIFNNDFSKTSIWVTKPITLRGLIIYNCFILCCYKSILVQYVSFYGIIRNEFIANKEESEKSRKNLLSGKDLKRYEKMFSEEVDSFLQKSTSESGSKEPLISDSRRDSKSSFGSIKPYEVIIEPSEDTI